MRNIFIQIREALQKENGDLLKNIFYVFQPKFRLSKLESFSIIMTFSDTCRPIGTYSIYKFWAVFFNSKYMGIHETHFLFFFLITNYRNLPCHLKQFREVLNKYWLIDISSLFQLTGKKLWSLAKTTNGKYTTSIGLSSPRKRNWSWHFLKRSHDFSCETFNSILAKNWTLTCNNKSFPWRAEKMKTN